MSIPLQKLIAEEELFSSAFNDPDTAAWVQLILENKELEFRGLTGDALEEKLKELSEDPIILDTQSQMRSQIDVLSKVLNEIESELRTHALKEQGYEKAHTSISHYDEIITTCLHSENHPQGVLVARGYFPEGTPPKDAVFSPLSLSYMLGNERFSHGRLECGAGMKGGGVCGNSDLLAERAAKVSIVREPSEPERIDSFLRSLTTDFSRDMNFLYHNPEQFIIDNCFWPFIDYFSIDHESEEDTVQVAFREKKVQRIVWDSVDKEALYRALQLYKMGGMELEQLLGQTNTMVRYFKNQIDNFVSSPIVAIRTRIKDMGRWGDKLIAFAYQQESDNPDLQTSVPQDLYGCRVILPDEDLCYKMLEYIERHKGKWTLIPGSVKDFIKNPMEGRDYQSIHVKVEKNNIPYAIQLRTFDMDRKCELDTRLNHRTYLDRKIDIINRCPEHIQGLIRTVLNVYQRERSLRM